MNLQDFFENIDRAQQRVKQLPADFRPANTSPQLAGAYPGQNATRGYLVGEGQDTSDSPMAQAVTRRIMNQHPEWLERYGVETLMQVIDAVTAGEEDWEEIGSSDVSAFVNMVGDRLTDWAGSREEMRDRRPFAEQGVSEGTADIQRKVFKKNGKPVGEVGMDLDASPGQGDWYIKHYASDTDLSGYDSYAEAVQELKHLVRQGVAEAGYNPLDDERREQRRMDQERAEFKRDELEAELGGEEQRYRDIMSGTWYILINGRPWQRQGQPVTFLGRAAARRAGQTIKNRDPQKTVTITRELPTTEGQDLAEIQQRLSQQFAAEDVLGGMRQRLGDMIQAKAEQRARQMQRRQPPREVLGEPVRRIEIAPGQVLEIHGNEDDGFRIHMGERSMPTRFTTLEHAEIATEMFLRLDEGKKDACYHKVKSRVKIWPSAYASGQLVQCRKRGADNWGTGGKKK
jgi:hypothetical protein